MAGPVPVRELRLMLQQLLADRFKLILHHETKETPVYELTVAKGGPKLPKPRPPDDPVKRRSNETGAADAG